MKAIIHTAFGAPTAVLQLREIEQPALGADQVLVRVEAVALAKGDWLITRGLPYIARPSYGLRAPKQPVAGLEFAGRVVAIGADVSVDVAEIAPGDDVFGFSSGALAEFVAAPASMLAKKPDNVTYAQAAAAPVSGLAALQALRDEAKVQPGERVLIIGASGGVGSFAVQIAKAIGAVVTGVASTRHLPLLRTLGADAVIDYTRDEITAAGAPYDVIIDIAGNRPVSLLRRALTPDGRLIIVGGSGGRWTMGFGRTIRAMLLSPFVRQRLVGMISSPDGDALRTLASMMASGRLAPVVDSTYPLPRAAEAIDLVGAGHGAGNLVITV